MKSEREILLDIIETFETCPLNESNCSTCEFIRKNVNFNELRNKFYKGL